MELMGQELAAGVASIAPLELLIARCSRPGEHVPVTSVWVESLERLRTRS